MRGGKYHEVRDNFGEANSDFPIDTFLPKLRAIDSNSSIWESKCVKVHLRLEFSRDDWQNYDDADKHSRNPDETGSYLTFLYLTDI